jgi:hypothetical protein
MPSAIVDGLATRHEVVGSGPLILMHAPGGCNAQTADTTSARMLDFFERVNA